MVQERLDYEQRHSTAAPKWRLGMSRLAPPVRMRVDIKKLAMGPSLLIFAFHNDQVPAKYNPDAYSEENAGTRLDQLLSIKTTKLREVRPPLLPCLAPPN